MQYYYRHETFNNILDRFVLQDTLIDAETTVLYVADYRAHGYKLHACQYSEVKLRDILVGKIWCLSKTQLNRLISEEQANARDILFPNNRLTDEFLTGEQLAQLNIDVTQERNLLSRVSECMRFTSSELNPSPQSLSYFDSDEGGLCPLNILNTLLYITPSPNNPERYRVYADDFEREDYALRVDSHIHYVSTARLLELMYGNNIAHTCRVFPEGVLTSDTLALDEVQEILGINPTANRTFSIFERMLSTIEYTPTNYGLNIVEWPLRPANEALQVSPLSFLSRQSPSEADITPDTTFAPMQ